MLLSAVRCFSSGFNACDVGIDVLGLMRCQLSVDAGGCILREPLLDVRNGGEDGCRESSNWVTLHDGGNVLGRSDRDGDGWGHHDDDLARQIRDVLGDGVPRAFLGTYSERLLHDVSVHDELVRDELVRDGLVCDGAFHDVRNDRDCDDGLAIDDIVHFQSQSHCTDDGIFPMLVLVACYTLDVA